MKFERIWFVDKDDRLWLGVWLLLEKKLGWGLW